MARTDSVKLNIELGQALKNQLRLDAERSCRKLSWQLNYYIQLSLDHPPLRVKPEETLDDNDGRMTAYLKESAWNTLQDMAESLGCNLSAVVRSCLIHGRQIERWLNAEGTDIR
jgi:hypothetical protein